MPTEKVRASLERIRAEAIKKAHQGIAQQRAKIGPRQVEEIAAKLKEGLAGPAVVEVAQKTSRKVVDRFISTFESTLAEVTQRAKQQTDFPTAARNGDGEIMLYPDGCRFMNVVQNTNNRAGQYGFMVVEQPPQVRTILVDMEQKHLPMPYVVFVVHFSKTGGWYNFSGIYVGFNIKPLKSLDDRLYNPPLPNFGGHNVCMGSYEGNPNADSPAAVAEHAVSTFWQSVFADAMQDFRYKNRNVSRWEQWAKIPPLDILKAEFEEGNRLRELLPHGATALTPAEQRQLAEVVQTAWGKIAKDLTVEEATALIQGASQEVLARLLSILTLQPQQNEVESQRQ